MIKLGQTAEGARLFHREWSSIAAALADPNEPDREFYEGYGYSLLGQKMTDVREGIDMKTRAPLEAGKWRRRLDYYESLPDARNDADACLFPADAPAQNLARYEANASRELKHAMETFMKLRLRADDDVLGSCGEEVGPEPSAEQTPEAVEPEPVAPPEPAAAAKKTARNPQPRTMPPAPNEPEPSAPSSGVKAAATAAEGTRPAEKAGR